jgi:hypothetical protein
MEQNLAEIEKNQASLRDLIEQSKRLFAESDDLLHRSRKEPQPETES